MTIRYFLNMIKFYSKTLQIIIILLSVIYSNAFAEGRRINTFDIWEYVIDGNTLIDKSLIQNAVTPYLGPGKNLKTVEQARDHLQNIYKQYDYPIVVVKIPEQNVVGGIVKLQVIEGKIDRTKISGNQYFSRREMKKELPSLAPGYPLNMKLVREEIDNLNRKNSYLSITPIIRPGRNPGTMEMEMKVKDRLPVWAFVETNNRYSSLTTETRATISAGYENLWQKHHAMSLSYMTSPENTDEVSTWSMSYSLPTGRRSKLAIFAMDSDSRVGFASDSDDILVQGTGKTLGLRSVHSLQSRQGNNHVLVFGADYKSFEELVTITNAGDQQQVPIPIDYVGFTISYNVSLKKATRLSNYNFSTNFGIRGLNNKDEEFDFKRFAAGSNYFYITAGLMHEHNLAKDWYLDYSLKGQYTGSALISNEQLSAGGVASVRGYTESVALGDYGYIGNIELYYRPVLKKSWLKNLFFSVYVDASNLYVHDSIATDSSGNIQDSYELLGTGVGFGMAAKKNLNLSLYYAKAQKGLGQDNLSSNPLLHFSVSAKF